MTLYQDYFYTLTYLWNGKPIKNLKHTFDEILNRVRYHVSDHDDISDLKCYKYRYDEYTGNYEIVESINLYKWI